MQPKPAPAQSGPLLAQWRLLTAATRDTRLSRADCAVLGSILDRMDKTGTAWPGFGTISADAGVSRRSAIRSVTRLCGLAYLDRDSGRPGKSNRYKPGAGSANPVPSDESVTSANPVPTVVTNLSPAVVTDLAPELASLNLPHELAQEALVLAPLAEPTQTTSEFDRFWKAYPRKVGSKAKARKSWERQKLDKLADRIIEGVELRALIDPQWQDVQFIPHPTTYLGNQRWDDDWQVGTLVQRQGESRNDLIARLQQEAEERAVAKMCVVDRVAFYAAKGDERERAHGMRTVNRKPSAADNFTGKVYVGTPIDDLHPHLRDAVKRDLAEFEAAQAAKGWLDE